VKLKKLVTQKIAEHNQHKEEKEIFAVLDQYLGYIFPIDKKEMLANMSLTINPSKEQVLDNQHFFKFLGFNVLPLKTGSNDISNNRSEYLTSPF